MKKYLKYIPHILFAGLMIGFGAIGKLTGQAPAVAMFTQIDLFGQGEAFGRILVGLAQVFAGVGIFFKPTRKIAAILGMGIMAGAIYYHITLIGGSPILAIATFILSGYLLVSSKCCGKKCGNGTCGSGTCKA